MYKTKIWYMSANKLFSGLSEKDKNDMASMLTAVKIRKNGVVYKSGDKADTIYILKEGRVKITRFSSNRKELTVDILEPEDIFGELVMAGEERRETNAVAMEDSLICSIRRKDFEWFIRRIPDLSLAITKWIGLRLRRIEGRFENMLFQDVRTRLITVFKDLAQKYGVSVKNGIKITIHLSHKDLASLIGASRETVTLELNNLKKSGDILSDGKYFILPSRHIS
ncbi:MAG: Crp/Fnr family transcriptional regulator [Deltaproteobacteria bacterium]|nr:Crp/Fnr family transcriptional regulator [Deltaproteobacteria bacterium]